MAGHAQLKFVMTECSKTQICLTGLIWYVVITLKFEQGGFTIPINIGSYMRAYVFIEFIKRVGEKDRCEAVPSISSVFPAFKKFNNTGA